MLCTATRLHAQNISTVAGTGTSGFAGDAAAATAAQLNSPGGIALDIAGNLYIADVNNNRVRKVTPAGVISTIAGNGTAGFAGDGGAATAAQLKRPSHVAVDGSGNVYITDGDNARIRKVTASGTISTYAGNGSLGFAGDGGPATAGKLYQPAAICLDASGNLYIADGFNQRIRKVDAAGMLSTVAGKGTYGFSGDGGPAINAEFNGTVGLARDAAGNIFVADKTNNRIRKIDPTNVISTYAGKDTGGYSGDGGAATIAKLKTPTAVRVSKTNELVFVDYGNNVIRKVSTAGVITTIAGSGALGTTGDGGPATAAKFTWPSDIAFDTAGNIYIADQGNHKVRKIQMVTPAGTPALSEMGTAVTIFPNPAQGSFTISLPADAYGGVLTIQDISGRLIDSKKIETHEKEVRHTLNGYAEGLYLVRISTGEKSYYGRVFMR